MAAKAADLYKHDKMRERNFERRLIEFGNDKDVVESFLNQRIAEGLSSARVNKYFTTMIPLNRMLKKDFIEANEDDIKKLAIEIEKSERSSAT
jgi:hypothetical protein